MKKIISLVFIFILFISCSRETQKDEVSSATWEQDGEIIPVAVEVLEVTLGQLVPYVEASGIIRGEKEAWVISETTGKISSINASLGQTVKEGEVLFSVENDLQKLNRDLALQQYESAELDFQAFENSFKSGGLSRSDYNAARSRLLQARSAFESANMVWEATYLKAPFDGSVALLDNSLAVGGNLSPGTAAALVIDRRRMKMEVSLGERQIGLIEEGQKAEVFVSTLSGDAPIDGRVEAIGAGSDSRTGSFPVLISWESVDPESLRSGLTAGVLMENAREEKRMIVPSSAIVVRNRKKSLFVARDGKASLVEITTGEALGGHTVVEKGLNEGDLLIVSALTSLSDGYPVETSLAGETGDWR